MHSSIARPLTAIAQRSSRRNDTFEAARELGKLSPRFGKAQFRVSGSVSRSDSKDLYKVSLLPGASLSGGITRYNVKGAPIRVRVFGELRGQRFAAGSLVVEAGKSTKGNPSERVTNSESSPIILYYQISRVNQDATYRATFSLFQ